MVCLVALVESSTTNVDWLLRESTRALTTTLPNSVTWLLGIFSVSSRSRSALGFHSTDAAITSYTTTAPFHGRSCGSLRRARSPWRRTKRALHVRDWGSVPRHAGIKYARARQVYARFPAQTRG